MTRVILRAATALAVALTLGAANAPDARRWWSHVLFLADDKLEGRRRPAVKDIGKPRRTWRESSSAAGCGRRECPATYNL